MMTIKKVETNQEFLNLLKQYDYEDYVSFCIYPFADTKIGKKENVSLPQTEIENPSFVNKINIKNGIVFIGENAAYRYKSTNSYNKFQAMHDITSKSNDYRTARMINSIEHPNKVLGSFICDIFMNVISTNLSVAKKVVDDIDNVDLSNIKDNPFSVSNINPINSNLLNDFESRDHKEKQNIKDQQKEINKLQNDLDTMIANDKGMQNLKEKITNTKNKMQSFSVYDPKYQMLLEQLNILQNKEYNFLGNQDYKNFNHKIIEKEFLLQKNIDINNYQTKSLVKLNRKELETSLKKHLINIDIPAFNFLMKSLKPTKIITLGNIAHDLVDKLNVKLGIGAKVYKLPHFSAPVSDDERTRLLNEFVETKIGDNN